MQQKRPRLSNRQQIALAVLGSVLINLGLACAVALAAQLWPSAAPEDDPGPIKVSFTSEPEPEPAAEPQMTEVVKPTPPPYQETLERQRSDHPPDEAVAESDKDTQAASELEAKNNDRHAPTQDGREGPMFAFDTREYTAGEKARENTAQPPPEPPAPTPPPAVDPPRPQVNRAAARPSPTPPPVAAAPTPSPAPTPLPGRAEAREFAMLAPTPTPPPRPSPEEIDPRETDVPRPKPSLPPLDLARPRARTPQPIVKLPDTPGYQSQTQRSRIEGGISNRGPSSIAARDTPLGRYNKALSDAIGSRWYFYAKQREGLIPIGMVRINFSVDAGGKVRNVRVIEGDPNNSLAIMSMEALTEAIIPPIPPEVAAALPGNRLEITFSFAEL